MAPALAHAIPAPKGAPHVWREEEESAFAGTGTGTGTGIGCFPGERAEAPAGGASCGIGTIPGAKEEGTAADDDDAIGWLDDPACPSGTGIGPGGASSSSTPDELPPLSSSSLSWSRNDTSGRKAVFLSSPISPHRHFFGHRAILAACM